MSAASGSAVRAELVVDVASVWAYIAYARFERAAARFRTRGGHIEVSFGVYQLNPHGPGDSEPAAGLAALAAVDGIEVRSGRAVYANTHEAHRLVAQAARQGRGEAMTARLFRAYHADGLDVGDVGTLAVLAREAGVLFDPERDAELEAVFARVRRLGIASVPVFIFNDELVMLGLQPEDAFLGALERAGDRSLRVA